MAKILIIEDEAEIREILVEILSEADHETFMAENGRLGLELARQVCPELVICDVMMPELDGYGVLNAVRQDPNLETVPFIFLTAKAEKSQVRQGMQLGADDYLPKPFTISELLGTVETRLQRRATIEQASQQKLDELRHNLTRSLPHELLTPLNGILGYATFLCEDSEEIEAEEIYVMGQSIRQSAERLHHLIQNFLLYAQLELIQDDRQRIANLFHGSTASIARALSPTLKNIASRYQRIEDLQIELDDTSVELSENWLNKIAEELLDNAFKFSSAGTPVIVRSQCQGNFLHLCVSDRGRGFQPEQIARIGAYEQFERKIYEQQGTGLGLEIVRSIARFNQGELNIQLPVDGETLVVVSLPLASVSDG